MKEIVTLQLGNPSNYVATHFWNTQESYFAYQDDDGGKQGSPVNHDVHWRAGVGVDGSDTYLPRTVIYDLKGGFGSLRETNALYDPGPSPDHRGKQALWDGIQVAQRLPSIAPSQYVESLDKGVPAPRLDTTSVRYWSDFARTFYHPRSFVQLYDYQLNSTIAPFDTWDLGRDLFTSLDKHEDVVDRDWRPFVEECDQMQGIQVMTSLDDAWGGFASAYLERLRDENPKSCIWTWGLRPPQPPQPQIRRDQRLRLLSNYVKALSSISDHASTLVPVSLPEEQGLPASLAVDRASQWHVSAALATGLESATMASRTRDPSAGTAQHLDDLSQSLNARGNQTVAKLSFSVQFLPERCSRASHSDGTHRERDNATSHQEDSYTETHDIGAGAVDLSTFPALGRPHATTNATVTDSDSCHVFGSVLTVRSPSLLENRSWEPVARSLAQARTIRLDSTLAFPLLDSFPQIYTQVPEAAYNGGGGVGVRAMLSTDTSLVRDFKLLRSNAQALTGFDDRELALNNLGDLADAYKEGWCSGSDEDDDD